MESKNFQSTGADTDPNVIDTVQTPIGHVPWKVFVDVFYSS